MICERNLLHLKLICFLHVLKDDPLDPHKLLRDVDNDNTCATSAFSFLIYIYRRSVITLTSWYFFPALVSTSTSQFTPISYTIPKNDLLVSLAAFFAGGPEPVPNSGLINSARRYSGGPAVPRTQVNVTKVFRYRFVSLAYPRKVGTSLSVIGLF